MKSARLIMIGVLAAAAFVAVLALYAIPQPVSWKGSALLFRLPLVLTCVYVVFHLAAGLLFLTTLDVYKAGLRRAYAAIAAGIMLLGLASIQLPIISAFNLWNSAWATRGGIVLPFVLTGIITYSGIRSFARLINIRHWLTRFGLVLPMIASLCALSAFLPHVAANRPEIVFDISSAIIIWVSLFYAVCALTAAQIMRSVGAHYTQAMAWLVGGLATSSLVLAVAISHTFLISAEQGDSAILIGVLGLISGVLYLMAGYAFAKTREY
ncbi:MAG: hypothetical protein JWN01_745 [Patescibacteria group bacterium]|nr:hypothetical protein [Patescibacteria group bacterium]